MFTHLQSHLSLAARVCALCPFKLKSSSVMSSPLTILTWSNLPGNAHDDTSTQTHTVSSYQHFDGHDSSRGGQEDKESTCVERDWPNGGKEQEAIRGFLFTSQSTQTQVDPTAEEQSVEEIKKQGQRAQSKHIPSASHQFPGAAPHNALWEMPTFTNAQSVPPGAQTYEEQSLYQTSAAVFPGV